MHHGNGGTRIPHHQQKRTSNRILTTHTLRVCKKGEEEPYCSCLGVVPLDTGIWRDSNTDQDTEHPLR